MNESFFVIRTNCPACGSAHSQELYAASFTEPPIRNYLEEFYSPQGGVEFDYLKEAQFILDECKQCGLIFQRFIPNYFLMSKLYEQWIDPERVFDLEVKNRGIEYFARLAREIDRVIEHFGAKPSSLDLFDFGMGWGEWCRMAQAYGCSVFGTELSQTKIDYAKRFGFSIITWDEISEHQFDFINTEQVFEHISSPSETLKYLSKSLKPNGLIRISVPSAWDIKRRLAIMDWKAPKGSKNSLNAIAPLEHINCFSYASLLRMGQIAGLVPVNMQARIRLDRTILNFTLRDIMRPFYRWMVKAKYSQEHFLQKRIT